MTAADLLRYRVRSLRRRASGAGSVAATLGLALPVAAAAALALAFLRLAGSDLAGADAEAALRLARDRAFWLNVLQALIFAYTTFEVIFRASDARFVALLPMPGRSRWLDLLGRAAAVHLPLLLPGAAYAAGLATGGAATAALQAGLTVGLTWLLGIPTCALLHLLAGRSLLSESSALKRWMAGGVVQDDAAMLLYSPAAGLAITLVAAILLGEMVHAGLGGSSGEVSPGTLAGVSGAVAVAAGWLALRGAREAEQVLPFVVARFAEVDVAPPYREDGLPEDTPGEGLARRLPRRVQPYFLRDLRQLRRRHRLDRILLFLHAAVMGRLALVDAPPLEAAADALTLTLLFVGLILVPAFRLHGRELASPWLDRTVTGEPGAARLGELAASAIHPAWALLWASLAAGVAGGPLAGLATAGVGLVATLLLLLTARATARGATPERAAVLSVVWKAGLLALIAAIRWRWP
ncbi:MAG: hypothetical protein ACQEXJ_23770 [Myxococcota bacterium]